MTDIDATKLPVMLSSLRLPTISRLWPGFAERADREGWGAARFLAVLCEHELAERTERRIARHMAESDLPEGKTLATFDFAAVPTLRKPHVEALGHGDGWIERGANVLIFGPSETATYCPISGPGRNDPLPFPSPVRRTCRRRPASPLARHRRAGGRAAGRHGDPRAGMDDRAGGRQRQPL